jgi:transposase-like protein
VITTSASWVEEYWSQQPNRGVIAGPTRADTVGSHIESARLVRGLLNRAENSHRSLRKRERAMQRFKSAEHARGFLETFSTVCNHFRPRRHRLSARRYRQVMTERFERWTSTSASRHQLVNPGPAA